VVGKDPLAIVGVKEIDEELGIPEPLVG